MDRIKLTKDKLLEILGKYDDSETMDYYYNAALEDRIQADQYLSIIMLLFMLVRYYHDKLFIKSDVNPISFMGLKNFNEESEYWKYGELLRKTNFMIAYALIHDEEIPDKSLVEFNDTHSIYLFCIGDYFKCLKNCTNSLFRDENNSLSNFIKASLIELCYINRVSDDYGIALLNYQKSLIDKCNDDNPGFDINIYKKVLESINIRVNLLSSVEKSIILTPILETYEETKRVLPDWTEEKDFYLRNNLFLNPLNMFGKFAEVSVEVFQDINLDKENREMFKELVKDYKMCRRTLFLYYKKYENVDKRKVSMVYSYLYSIFDKTAYLIKNVYNLDIQESRIYFTDDGLFNKKFKDMDMKFKELSNFTVLPLYLIMKDVRTQNKIEDALQVGTFEHNELRNSIDHKSIYLVDSDKLKRNILILLGKTRDTILYTFMLFYSQSSNVEYDKFSTIYTTYFYALDSMNKK